MSDGGIFWLIAFLLVMANGFFVATEFAIVKIRPTRLQSLVDEGSPGAANAMKVVSRLDAYLSATQFGITLVSLGLGALEPRLAAMIEHGLHKLTGIQSETASHGIAFGGITFLHIILGELAPKSLAIQKAEATTLAVAWPMRAFYFAFYPAIVLLNGVSAWVLRLFGLHAASESHDAHTEEELKVILASSAQAGVISMARAELLGRALSMLEKTARQVMVPRNQTVFLDIEQPLDEAIKEARQGGHTWLPVVRGNLDQVEGVINVKDLFFLLSRGELKSLSQAQRSVLFVPENATLEQILSEFRRRRRQIAIVVDEHGGTSGMLTIADVVAEVVGDIAELGRKADEVRTLPGGRLELPGTAQLDELSDRLEVEFDNSDGEIATIGGYLMTKLARVPEKGDKCGVGDWEVVVEEMDGPRVVKVRVQPKVAPQPLPAAAKTTEAPSTSTRPPENS